MKISKMETILQMYLLNIPWPFWHELCEDYLFSCAIFFFFSLLYLFLLFFSSVIAIYEVTNIYVSRVCRIDSHRKWLVWVQMIMDRFVGCKRKSFYSSNPYRRFIFMLLLVMITWLLRRFMYPKPMNILCEKHKTITELNLWTDGHLR